MTRVKQEQIHEIYQHGIVGIIGHVFTVFFVVYMLSGNVENSWLYIWAFIILSVLFLRGTSLFIYKHTKQSINPYFNVNRWVFIYQIGAFFTAVLWGIVTFLFAEQYQLADLHFIMLAIIFGLAGSGVAIFGSVFSIYVIFSVPMVVMVSFSLLTSNKVNHFEFGILSIYGLLFLLFTALKHSKKSLEVIQRTNEVERSKLDVVKRLGKAGEFRDSETGLHIKRMSYSSYLLALESGLLMKDAKQIRLASPMHDIGKIGIPDSILLKPGKLTNKELQIMQTHSTIGAELLDSHDSKLLKLAAIIAANHHEKWDGSGYPKGLAGDSIPIEARIVSICDVFDALISVRPYKKAWSTEDALKLIKEESGKHFDANLVNCFISISEQIVEYTNRHPDK